MLTLRTLDFLCAVTIRSSMAVLFAAVGEVLAEQSGVLNLGVEGMMLMGALSGFGAASATHSLWLGVLAAMAAGGLLALLYALFAITLRANQVVCGLSLTILGTGLSSFLGRPLIGRMGPRFGPWPVPGLRHLPVLGPVLFTHVPLVYIGLLCVPAAWFLLFQTRPGLHLRAVGEHPEAADTAGIPVNRVRYLCTVTGGMLAGLGGA
jgi:simple sugar transport system permease protein